MSYPPGDPSSAAPADFRDTDRPTTARPATSSDYLYSQDDPQYTYSQEGIEEEEEEEEDESEDEDVFAYLPPTTAEQQAQEAQEGHDDHLSHTSDPATLFQSTHSQLPASSTRSTAVDSRPPHNPADLSPPTYPSHGPPMTAFSSLFPVDTPPSTDSQADHNDPYRLRRVPLYADVPSSPPANVTPPVSGNLSVARSPSQGVRVQLTPSDLVDDYEKSSDLEDGMRRRTSYSGKERPISVASAAMSMSITPSMLDYTDGESRDGSIKYVEYCP